MIFAQYPYQNFSDYNLDWIIKTVKKYTNRVLELEDWRTETDAAIEGINQFIADIRSGNYPEDVKRNIIKFITDNFYDIVGEMIKMVFFGLTDSGYFVAYIPENWDDIQFSTSQYDDFTSLETEYGHLILSY